MHACTHTPGRKKRAFMLDEDLVCMYASVRCVLPAISMRAFMRVYCPNHNTCRLLSAYLSTADASLMLPCAFARAFSTCLHAGRMFDHRTRASSTAGWDRGGCRYRCMVSACPHQTACMSHGRQLTLPSSQAQCGSKLSNIHACKCASVSTSTQLRHGGTPVCCVDLLLCCGYTRCCNCYRPPKCHLL